MAFDKALDHLGPETFRRGFSELFDRAAIGVYRAGYDLDDIVLKRFLHCQTPSGHELLVPADSLSDPARLTDAIMRAVQNGPEKNLRTDEIHITALTVIVMLDQPLSFHIP